MMVNDATSGSAWVNSQKGVDMKHLKQFCNKSNWKFPALYKNVLEYCENTVYLLEFLKKISGVSAKVLHTFTFYMQVFFFEQLPKSLSKSEFVNKVQFVP